MRGPHDVGGLSEGPIDTEPHALTFWERQIDGLRAAVGAKGLMTSHESRRAIESLGHEAYEMLRYYERWTAALSRQMVDKAILTQDEIDAKVAAIRRRLADDGELALRPGEGEKVS
jgi:nitrile hydratase subunit beta